MVHMGNRAMTDDKKGPEQGSRHRTAEDDALHDEGAWRQASCPVEKPSLEVLRSEVAKVAKKTKAKKAAKKKWRRK